jgi:hypothetical protein
LTENGTPKNRAFAPTVEVRVGENVREAEPEQITGKDNLSSVLRQERKAKKRAVGDERRPPKRPKTRNRRRVRFYFTRFAVFGKRRKTKFSAKFSKTLAQAPLARVST